MTSNAVYPVTPLEGMTLIGRGVVIELIRRKDLYVLSMLIGVYLLGVLTVSIVGIERASTAAFLLNLGLTLTYILSHILALVLVARQVPDDIENRTIYPLLAKPVDRPVYLLGKWVSCALCAVFALIILGLVAWVPVPRTGLELYTGMLAQAVVLLAVSIAMLSALVLLFSLIMPKGVNIVLTGLIVAFGEKLTGLVLSRLQGGAFEKPAEWVAAYLPNFGKLNLLTRYTDGIVPLGPGEFLGLVAYGALFTVVFLALSMYLFNRRVL